MNLPDIYVSTDIETNGQVPGLHSMLSLGSAAFFDDKTLIDTFSANVETLPEATANQEKMKWWKTQPKAWKACRENLEHPASAMKNYCRWLEQLPGNIIFVGYPMAFDFRFVDYYFHRFVGRNPFGYSTVDIRSYIMGMKNLRIHHAGIHQVPKQLFDDLPHTHIAIEDAIKQGALFCNLLAENNRTKINNPDEEMIDE